MPSDENRRLASAREDLIAAGVTPAELLAATGGDEQPGMERRPCGRAQSGIPHRPHIHRSALTGRYLRCLGGPLLRWEGDDS